MSLSIGIVGLPNVGKSTLFNAFLKRQAALAANYPFATIEPNLGIVDVPDERLEILASIVRNDFGNKLGDRQVPEKIIPAMIEFYDIAGLVKGASQGEGLGNEFLGHIRSVDAIIQVVRDFEDSNVIRAGSISPSEDIETINTELILADLQSIDKKINFLERDSRGSKDKDIFEKIRIAKEIKEILNQGKLASCIDMSNEDKYLVKELDLLTLKPMIYVYNVAEDNVSKSRLDDKRGGNELFICAKVESDLASFSEEEKKDYMKELGIEISGLDKIIRKGYEILGLENYFTMGPKEVRAWTIEKGSKAPEAAGKIHSDFERGFISAEVISYDDMVKAQYTKKAKELGLIRLEGKNYIVKDGDIIEFRFSV